MTQTLIDPRMFNTAQALGAHDGSALTGLPTDWVLLGTQTASSSSSIDWGSAYFDAATYESYCWIISQAAAATDATYIAVRTSSDGGSTYDATAGHYRTASHAWDDGSSTESGSNTNTSADEIILNGGSFGNATGEFFGGQVWLHAPDNAEYTYVTSLLYGGNIVTRAQHHRASGVRLSSADVDGLRFKMNSGNIASGTFKMYGIK